MREPRLEGWQEPAVNNTQVSLKPGAFTWLLRLEHVKSRTEI